MYRTVKLIMVNITCNLHRENFSNSRKWDENSIFNETFHFSATTEKLYETIPFLFIVSCVIFHFSSYSNIERQ